MPKTLSTLAANVVTILFGDTVIPEKAITILAMAVVEASPHMKRATAEQLSEIHESLVDALRAMNATKSTGVN